MTQEWFCKSHSEVNETAHQRNWSRYRQRGSWGCASLCLQGLADPVHDCVPLVGSQVPVKVQQRVLFHAGGWIPRCKCVYVAAHLRLDLLSTLQKPQCTSVSTQSPLLTIFADACSTMAYRLSADDSTRCGCRQLNNAGGLAPHRRAIDMLCTVAQPECHKQVSGPDLDLWPAQVFAQELHHVHVHEVAQVAERGRRRARLILICASVGHVKSANMLPQFRH
jgi:hypothetical protein